MTHFASWRNNESTRTDVSGWGQCEGQGRVQHGWLWEVWITRKGSVFKCFIFNAHKIVCYTTGAKVRFCTSLLVWPDLSLGRRGESIDQCKESLIQKHRQDVLRQKGRSESWQINTRTHWKWEPKEQKK